MAVCAKCGFELPNNGFEMQGNNGLRTASLAWMSMLYVNKYMHSREPLKLPDIAVTWGFIVKR